MDDYRNEYLNLNKILLNALYLMNPYEKIMFKHSQESTSDRLLLGYYNIYFQRMFYTVKPIKKMILNLETRKYKKKKPEYNYIHKINRINDKAKFKLTNKLIGVFSNKKQKRKKMFLDIEENTDENNNNDKNNEDN